MSDSTAVSSRSALEFGYPASDCFALNDQQVHVWLVDVKQTKPCQEELAQTLAGEELQKGARFYRLEDRERFFAVRGTLRLILAGYLKTAPQQLRFVYGEHGKPVLEKSLPQNVRFNVSHSQNLALFAVALNCEVGVDIEAIRSDFDVESIALRYFTSQESAMICAAPADSKHEAFFRCWTLKEAFAKACGLGLAAIFEQAEISPAGHLSEKFAGLQSERERPSRWSIQELPILGGYKAALAFEGKQKAVQCWQWPEKLNM
jgi:4'-phosphopantetheinyl transferase